MNSERADDRSANPVFDYRAAFRRRAAAAQHFLIFAGLALCVVAGVLWLFAWNLPRVCTGATALIGAALLFIGIGWGYYWRWDVRRDFLKKFGPS